MPVDLSSSIPSSTVAFQDVLFDPALFACQLKATCAAFRGHSKPVSSADLGFGILSYFCGPELIDRVLDDGDRNQRRSRLLPARLVVYGCLLMCLHPDRGYQRLMDEMAKAAPLPGTWSPPNKSSFCRARARLGPEVLERLFFAQARTLAGAPLEAPCCFWRGRRVMAIDGTTIELQNSSSLREEFGGVTNEKGELVGVPLLRAASLCECGTRAAVDAAFGPYTADENQLVTPLVRSVTPGMLVLADRNFPGVELWRAYLRAGADLVWRVQSNVATRIIEHLPDGTYLARFGSGKDHAVVRVVEYTVEGSEEIYRLITNLLDPLMAPASELARLYAERWEVETSYKELKTFQNKRLPFRSMSTEGVQQEFWANLILYNLNRRLAYQAAMTIDKRDPDRISFSRAQDAIAGSAARFTGLQARRLLSEFRFATRELTRDRDLLVRRDRVCPRVKRHTKGRYPSRARHDGPLSQHQSRRPGIFVLEPIPSGSAESTHVP
jgi:hypothetical protein